jgi:hypothetical protein
MSIISDRKRQHLIYDSDKRNCTRYFRGLLSILHSRLTVYDAREDAKDQMPVYKKITPPTVLIWIYNNQFPLL